MTVWRRSLHQMPLHLRPRLQRRALFRREYEGRTLRENLGLPRPENRFFPKQQVAIAAEG